MEFGFREEVGRRQNVELLEVSSLLFDDGKLSFGETSDESPS